jgi:hypothetical protein
VTGVVRERRIDHSAARPGFMLGPAPFQLAQNSPEQAAVHQAVNPAASPRAEGLRLGVFEMMRDLMEKRAEKLFDWTTAFDAVVRVNSHEAS